MAIKNPFKKTYDADKFEEIKTRAIQIESDYSKVKTMQQEIADLYWIHDENSNVKINKSAWDKNDILYTYSPASRNEVIGAHRLLRTSRPQFKVACKSEEYANKIEDMLNKWWQESCVGKRARVESDLTLSGFLFSDELLRAEAIADRLADEKLNKVRRARLERRQKITPVLFSIEQAYYAYPVFDDDGQSELLIKKTLKGLEIMKKWDVPALSKTSDYVYRDYYDLEYRGIWIEGQAAPLMLDQYDLDDMPVFATVADGTELFPEEHRKRQPLLYAKWRSNLHKREDELLTILHTSAAAWGTGKFAIIDPDNTGTIEMKTAGLLKYIVAKAQLSDTNAIDPNLLRLKELHDQLAQASTINTQTLGENIRPGTPYSGYAMAAQSGQLPVYPVKEATEKVIHDACLFILRRIQTGSIEWEGLKASEVPEDIGLDVTLEVDLPQDAYRNAQTATQLKAIGVSDEYIQTNVLKISDSNKMMADVFTEQASKEAFKYMLPQLLPKLWQMFMPPTPPPEINTQGQTHTMPDGTQMPGATHEGGVVAGGARGAQALGATTPMTGPIPPEEQNIGMA